MTHAEFEGLLCEAVDGTLSPADQERFNAHGAGCDLCAPALAFAQQGHRLVRGLPEVEPPAYLLQKILNVTSEVPARAPRQQESRRWTGLRPFFGVVLQPRFGMSFAMAFFSVMLMLNVTGVKVTDLRYVDLRPAAVKSSMVRSYYETTGRAQKYYENLRFVYQVQSALRDLRNATNSDDTQQEQPQPQQPQPKPQQQRQPGDNTSEQPQQNNQRYSAERSPMQLAAAPASNNVHQISFCADDRRTA
ncbi:MAG: zf-HC2 domain-containing protein [Candidatus Koribacter versatilis]|uniref:Zf-HC2 domain-containing protein n=1 Tax=Candidatus Korobacter versatilis TaxID=658062 RepID=A0A932EPZ0_9BACT|nr:zf-HC2 domain-containing protein [Candidatus Koribacter versatilis]